MGKLHYEYEKEWVALGYRKGMASNKVCLPPPAEFVRAYRFQSADHAISSIAFGRVKVSRVSEMNDPYELFPYKRSGELHKALPLLKKAIDKSVRFLCFSADWRSPLLWAHYADRHRGICLGFDMVREGTKTIDYKPERMVLAESLGTMSPERQQYFARELTAIKCDEWRYEEEIRAMVKLEKTTEEGNLRYYPMNENLRLAEVIVGLDCKIGIGRLRSFVHAKYPDAIVFGTREAEKWFHIVPNEETIS